MTLIDAAGAPLGTGNAKLSQFSIAGTGSLPLGSDFALFGKVGFTNNHAKAFIPGHLDASGTKTSGLLGFGVTYNITPQLGLRFEYEDFGKFGTGAGGSSIRADNISLGLHYAF